MRPVRLTTILPALQHSNHSLSTTRDKASKSGVAPVVIDDLELADIAFLHHDGQKAHDHLAARADKYLALATLLGVADRFQRIG